MHDAACSVYKKNPKIPKEQSSKESQGKTTSKKSDKSCKGLLQLRENETTSALAKPATVVLEVVDADLEAPAKIEAHVGNEELTADLEQEERRVPVSPEPAPVVLNERLDLRLR